MKSFKKFMVIGLVLVFALVALLPVSSGLATSKKQLVVWSHLTQNEVKALQPIADAWGKKNGYTVKVITDQGSFQSFQTAAMSGKGPDIMFGMPHDNLGTFWKARLLEPIPANLIDRKKFVSMSLDACS